MTTEFAMLLGVSGLAFAWFGWLRHDQLTNDADFLLRNPPRWMRSVARFGDGPLRTISVAWEIYGAGMAILALIVVIVGPRSVLLSSALAAWFLGGIVVIGIIDLLTSIRGWLRRRSRDLD